MKIKVISYGSDKSRYRTAQIVVISDGTSITRHLRFTGYGHWVDNYGNYYNTDLVPKKH